MSAPKLPTLGLRHLAIQVKDPQTTKKFYIDVMGMDLEWEPDQENVYLTSQGHDNLAIHQLDTVDTSKNQTLDHMGFVVPTLADVDTWYKHITGNDISIKKEIKTHRDGARSFYFEDPNGITIQIIFHPPISNR